MRKLMALAHRTYDGPDGRKVLFGEDTLALADADELHVRLLEAFRTPQNPDKVVAGIRDYNETEVREAVADLEELGVLAVKRPTRYLRVFGLAPRIRALRVVLTEQCNLRCAECFVTKNADRLRTMDRETLERVVRDSVAYGATERLTYHFFGGEPLIRFDYIRRTAEIVDEAVAAGLMVPPLYTITTNLTLLSDEVLDFFRTRDVKVGVSVDGLPEDNDRLRVYLNGRGSYGDVERNYARLLAAGVDAHILITPHASTLERLPEIFTALVARFPTRTVTVNTPLDHRTLAWTVPGEAYARTLFRVLRAAKELDISIDSAASPPLAALSAGIHRAGPCALTADRIMASVAPDGRISYCAQKWHHELTLPAVSDGPALRTPIHREDACEACEARHVCGGPCPAHQKITAEALDENKCAFMRTFLEEAARNVDLFEEADADSRPA